MTKVAYDGRVEAFVALANLDWAADQRTFDTNYLLSLGVDLDFIKKIQQATTGARSNQYNRTREVISSGLPFLLKLYVSGQLEMKVNELDDNSSTYNCGENIHDAVQLKRAGLYAESCDLYLSVMIQNGIIDARILYYLFKTVIASNNIDYAMVVLNLSINIRHNLPNNGEKCDQSFWKNEILYYAENVSSSFDKEGFLEDIGSLAGNRYYKFIADTDVIRSHLYGLEAKASKTLEKLLNDAIRAAFPSMSDEEFFMRKLKSILDAAQ